MALANKKSSDIFNKKTGGDTDSKSISTSKETEIKNKFDNGEHVEDNGMFETLAPALYAMQQLTEDVEELRRFVVSEITSITTSQASAITANTAKVSLEGGASTAISFGDLVTVPPKSKHGSATYYIVMTVTKSGVSKSITLTLT
tara:strand:+ start:427 stop:861 length:435 start_codon:yes stop_codon:yes gene_type:complete